MAEDQNSETPLEKAAGAAGPAVTEAFKTLSNETRLAILVALWEAYDPFTANTALSFSELRKEVGMRDSGQFSYHLGKLEDHFIEATEEGYELREAGLSFVQTIIAGAGIEEPTLEPTDVDIACSLCDGSVKLKYEDEWVYVFCTECEGLWTNSGDHPDGHLAKFSLDPAGLTNRSANQIYAAAWVRTFQKIYNMLEGVCPTCSGPVERSLEICEEHGSDGMCSDCGRKHRIAAQVHCTVCKEWSQMTLGVVVKYHPAVVGFFYQHGLELQYGFNDLSHIEQRLELTSTDVEQLSADPPRVRVTTEIDGDEIWLDLDDELTVIAVGD